MAGASGPIDHLDLVVSDLERSLRFYRGLLAPLGYSRLSEIEGERGERVVYIGREGGTTSSREVVDERARWLRAEGAEIESGPSEYGYAPGYYAVFVHDPDGIKLEIVHRPGAGPCC